MLGVARGLLARGAGKMAAAASGAGAVVAPALCVAAAQRAAWGGVQMRQWGNRSMSGPGQPPGGDAPEQAAKPEHEFDPELLRALEIDHIPPARIAEALKGENITIEQLKMLVDEGFHIQPEGRPMPMTAYEQEKAVFKVCAHARPCAPCMLHACARHAMHGIYGNHVT